jgi:hypothetical protein
VLVLVVLSVRLRLFCGLIHTSSRLPRGKRKWTPPTGELSRFSVSGPKGVARQNRKPRPL